MNTFLIFVQALATVVIAIYAYSNYKLSKIIKNENQEILDYLTVANLIDTANKSTEHNFLLFQEQLERYRDFKALS